MDVTTKVFVMIIDSILINKFKNNLNQSVNLSNYSWFNLGGKAEYFFKANNLIHLEEFLKETKKINLKTTILGAGSNTLFRDNGVKGAVIKLGKNFSYTKLIDQNIIEVGAATLDRKVANFAKDNNLGNLEFLSSDRFTVDLSALNDAKMKEFVTNCYKKCVEVRVQGRLNIDVANGSARLVAEEIFKVD